MQSNFIAMKASDAMSHDSSSFARLFACSLVRSFTPKPVVVEVASVEGLHRPFISPRKKKLPKSPRQCSHPIFLLGGLNRLVLPLAPPPSFSSASLFDHSSSSSLSSSTGRHIQSRGRFFRIPPAVGVACPSSACIRALRSRRRAVSRASEFGDVGARGMGEEAAVSTTSVEQGVAVHSFEVGISTL